MEKTIRATKAVRKFSELLNLIKFRGDEFTITRGGEPIAHMGPSKVSWIGKPIPAEITLGDLKMLLQKIPRLDEESFAFEKDLKEIIKHQPSLPEAS